MSTAPERIGARVAPMSFAQERLWLIDQAAPGSPIYNVPLLTRWHEPVDPAALAVALGHVVARHEVLRTTYRLDEDQPVQVVGEPADIAVEVIDAGDADVDAEVARRARQPFDLETDPVLRCTVWQGVPGGDLMLIVVHHIAIDGWSLAGFYADLAEAYHATLGGDHPDLPEMPFQYADFAVWDRESFLDPERQQQLSVRAAELVETDGELVLAGARPGEATAEGEQRSFELPPHLWSGVNELARALRATPFVVLSAVFQAVLHRRSGREDFVLGAVTANRQHPDVEPLVGFFVNTVPMRCQVSPEWTFRELSGHARAEAYRSLTYQWIPFDRLTSQLATSQAGGHRRLVNVCFALQNMPPPDVEHGRWAPPVVLPTGTAKFDLLLIVEQTQAGVIGTVEYDTGRYPGEVCQGVIENFLELLAAVIAHPDVTLRRLLVTDVSEQLRRTAADRRVELATLPTADVVHQRRAVELFADAFVTINANAGIDQASNFFALGGHSLLAVTMLAQAGHRYGTSVSPRDFLAEPTVAGLARLLASGSTIDQGNRGTSESDSWPATSAQQRFWFLDRIPALRTAYLMPAVIELSGEVNQEVLQAAVDEVIARHPALRSRFELDRKQRKVCYRTDGPPSVTTTTDATGWGPERLRTHVADLCWSGFDLASDAPARAEVMSVGPQRTLLVLVVHHIVADGWSQQLLLDQIGQVYRARLYTLAAPVHPSTLWREAPADQSDEVIRSLTGAPVDVELPHDRPRAEVQSTLAASTSVTLDEKLTTQLRAVAAESACTTFVVAAAVLAVTLARRGDQRDFVFAFPWGGRETPEAINAVGMLVNTLALRVDLRDVGTWREALARVRDNSALSCRNAEASFDKVAAALHPERDLSRPPLTPVYLSALERPFVPEFSDSVRARYLPLDPLHIKYELEFTVIGDWERLEFDLSYSVELFEDETIADLVADLVAAADDLGMHPGGNPLEVRSLAAPTVETAQM